MKTFSLALSGGGVRALAHAGLLKALEQYKFRPVAISGTSGGALVGALYASGIAPEEIKDFFKQTPLFKFSMLSFGKMGLIDSNKYPALFEKYLSCHMKKFDKAVQPKIKTGLEMLVNNFSAGILGFILAILGYFGIGPVVKVITNALSAGVDVIINTHLLPLANIFIEPAKILFLNNAINHGILTPIATEQALNTGKSVLYLLEANPGVGFGILLAYMFFGKGSAKASAPGAAIIHFIGGIHEIYFPYILMKPSLIIAAMAGGVSGTATFQLLDAGLRAPASPGSIIAVLAQTATGSYVAVVTGVVVSTLVTFVIASIILKRDKGEGDLEAAQSQVSSMKAEAKG